MCLFYSFRLQAKSHLEVQLLIGLLLQEEFMGLMYPLFFVAPCGMSSIFLTTIIITPFLLLFLSLLFDFYLFVFKIKIY